MMEFWITKKGKIRQMPSWSSLTAMERKRPGEWFTAAAVYPKLISIFDQRFNGSIFEYQPAYLKQATMQKLLKMVGAKT